MNKKGASKGKVLIIALSSDPMQALLDRDGFVLVFDTFKQIVEYCAENGINTDDVLIDELDKLSGEPDPIDWDNIEEVEF